jgi:hypothetical protein
MKTSSSIANRSLQLLRYNVFTGQAKNENQLIPRDSSRRAKKTVLLLARELQF